MGGLREIGARRQAERQQWLKREEERVGVLLWAVGITTIALLPDTGVFIPRHLPVFVGLKVVAAMLWLLVSKQCLQHFAKRNTHEP